MNHSLYTWIYIIVMALSTYFCRVLALTFIKRPIKNRFINSFLYYVPYVTLAVMTFPAIIEATRAPGAGLAALAVGIILAWVYPNLFVVAGSCCLTVFIVEMIML